MSKAEAMVRRQAHLFIYNHPLRDEFLAWIDEHEDVVDDLKLFVEHRRVGGRTPVDGATLIRTLRADFPEFREEWAPLVVHLLVWDFPELRPYLMLRERWNIPANARVSGDGSAEPQDGAPVERETEAG